MKCGWYTQEPKVLVKSQQTFFQTQKASYTFELTETVTICRRLAQLWARQDLTIWKVRWNQLPTLSKEAIMQLTPAVKVRIKRLVFYFSEKQKFHYHTCAWDSILSTHGLVNISTVNNVNDSFFPWIKSVDKPS